MELEQIKGIGPRTINTLRRLGINDSYDLMTYYPYRFNIIEKSDIALLNNDDKITMDGIIESIPTLCYLRGHKDKMDFRLNTGKSIMNIMIFNRGFLKSKLNIGTKVSIFGKYDKKKNTIIASDIRLGLISSLPKIEPVYHVTTGINSNGLNGLIKATFNDDIIDYIPNYLNEKYDFLSKKESLKEIHNPKNFSILKQAMSKLKYEELFIFMLKMNYLKEKKGTDGLKRDVPKIKVDEFITKLPFILTSDQIKSINEIYKDLISSKRMNRLLQGDVGSGKTVVAFASLYINYLGGYQGALMAPTEILAKQHYLNIKKTLPDLKIVLLTGKLKTKEKREIYKGLKDNSIDIVIGTHALISQDVKYNNLGLVITDEQHRFGVNQRSELKNKGLMPDILYMSATPIPRTYAITLFGDMDISNIKTKPVGRKDVITTLKMEADMKDVLKSMYQELQNNHQVYVIAPLIEESEKIVLENVNKLKEKMERAFGKLYNIGVMHGKLSGLEKEEVMTKFQNNELQILISTTVVEVGVDVSNATLMVVFDSYRFGLSALHQLRGRVGRSCIQSYFIMISNNEAERLNVLTKTNDGFLISEADFKLRGSGDLFGIKQSGDMQFKIADLKKDFQMLVKAKEDSKEFLDKYIIDVRYKHISDTLKQLTNLD
ncbi:MAG: ATP-dependent DNA helicase RecG [Bacilli bacterium]